jgi:hypothetical protein
MEEVENEMKNIGRVYRGPDGGKPDYKTYLDAMAIDPGITLNLVKGWFKLNVESKNQVWGNATATLPTTLTLSIRHTCSS